jgi:predicted ATPase/class 3 adenylate cyclase
MNSSLQALHSFVPVRFCEKLDLFSKSASPQSIEHQAAMLFVDISGFSNLASQLARQGRDGAEELMRLLDSYFGHMVEQIKEMGGDILKFAGDALIASWLLPEDWAEQEEVPLLLQAILCAQKLRETLNDFRAAPDVLLGLKIAVSVGSSTLMQVGGVGDRWELVVVGDTLRQFEQAMSMIQRGEVILSQQAAERSQPWIQGKWNETQSWVLTSIRWEQQLPAQPTELQSTSVEWQRYIPQTVLYRLSAGQSEWLSEIRWISLFFVGIRGISYGTEEGLPLLQQAISEIQQSLQQYGGALDKVQADEKGTSVLVAFGLPPTVVDRREQRALASAIDVFQRLDSLGLQVDIGVTSGRLFCGPVGNARRRQNSMMGNSANLAARLMQKAEHGILSDPRTVETAGPGSFEVQALEPLSLKGFKHQLTPYQVKGFQEHPQGKEAIEVELIGREEEVHRVQRSLQSLSNNQPTTLLAFEGEAGIGKSYLGAALLALSRKSDCRTLSGSALAIRQTTPWYVWQSVFSDFFSQKNLNSVEERTAFVLQSFKKQPETQQELALANSILQTQFSETEASRSLEGPARAHHIQQLLLFLLQRMVEEKPLFLLLDDAHWFDSSSWRLLKLVHQQIPSLLIVLLTRPVEYKQEDWKALLSNKATKHQKLGGLELSQVRQLVQERLAPLKVPREVVQWVFERGQGSPFVSRELCAVLMESLDLASILTQYRGIELHEHLEKLPVPSSLEGLVIRHIDSLSANAQFVLKTASVVGFHCSRSALLKVLPISLSDDDFEEALTSLLTLELLQEVKGTEQLNFVHRITQETAYGLLLRKQREELHQRFAEWMEEGYADELGDWYAVLAWHWNRTQQDSKAFEYLEKSAEQALQTGAYLEAKVFFKRALTRLSESGSSQAHVSSSRQAFWMRGLAESYYGTGQSEKNIQASEKTLSLLNRAVPRARWKLGLATIAHFWKFLGLHSLPNSWIQAKGREIRDIVTASIASHRLANAAYGAEDTLMITFGTLLAGNLALRVPAFPGSAKCLASLAMLMGWFQMKGIAAHYFQRAHRDAESIDDLDGLMFVNYSQPLYLLGEGREWDTFFSELEQAIHLCNRLGNLQEKENCWMIQGAGYVFQGELEKALDPWDKMRQLAASRDNLQHECWASYAAAIATNALGDTTRSLELLDRALDIGEIEGDMLDQVSHFSPRILKAQCLLQMGQLEEAMVLFEEGAKALHQNTTPVWSLVLTRTVAFEIALAFYRATREKKWLRECKQAMQGLKVTARILPIAGTYLLWCQACFSQVQKPGSRKAASLASKARHKASEQGLHWLEHKILCFLEDIVSSDDKSLSQERKALEDRLPSLTQTKK